MKIKVMLQDKVLIECESPHIPTSDFKFRLDIPESNIAGLTYEVKHDEPFVLLIDSIVVY